MTSSEIEKSDDKVSSGGKTTTNWKDAKFVQDVYIRMNEDEEKDYCFAVPIDGK
jgi:hypothetical protein